MCLIETEAEDLEGIEMGTEEVALGIDLGDEAVDAGGVIDILAVVALKKAGQPRGVELTGEPAVAAEVTPLSIVEQRADAIAVSLIVERERLAGEGAHHPMEEVIVGLDAEVVVFLQFRDEAIGIPRATDLMQIEDVEEGVGHLFIALARHAWSCIRATSVDPALLGYLLCQCQNRIEIREEAVLIDVDGDVTLLVLEHREEIAIGRLIREAHTRIARLLVEGTRGEIEFLVEGATVELNAHERNERMKK